MRSAHRMPLDLSLGTPQQEFKFSCAAPPARRLVCGPNDCHAAGISVGDRGIAHGAGSTAHDASIRLNGQGQAPNRPCRIAKQAQAIAGSRLIGSGVVARGEQRSELRFEIS
jgi:hypothetical protein